MFLYFYISIDIGALVRTTGAKDPSACLASLTLGNHSYAFVFCYAIILIYESFATVGEIRVWWRANFQSGSRVLKKVF